MTALPPLVILADEATYRSRFLSEYCHRSVTTFDGIHIRFYPEMFKHAFFRDSSPTAHDKAVFDRQRAERMDWIRAVLVDSSLELYRRVMPHRQLRRIALEMSTPYVVVVQLDSRDPTCGRFITAFIVDSASALAKIRSNPRW